MRRDWTIQDLTCGAGKDRGDRLKPGETGVGGLATNEPSEYLLDDHGDPEKRKTLVILHPGKFGPGCRPIAFDNLGLGHNR